MSNVQVQLGGQSIQVQVQSSGFARANAAVTLAAASAAAAEADAAAAAVSAAAAAATLAGAALKANNLSDLASAATARTNLGGTATGVALFTAADAAAARTAAGVVIGTDVQAYSANLDEYAGVNPTAAGLALLDDADASAQRATLGLDTMATQAASNVAITGGSIAGITDLAIADGGTGASTAAAARTALGTDLAANVNLPGVGTGSTTETVEDVLNAQAVSVLRYGAVGDGTTDDSAAIQAAIDANKGKRIVFPAGYTFNAANIILSGSTYNGTTLDIQGTFLVTGSDGETPVFSVPVWGGIILHNCEDITVDVPGMMDGNRAAMSDSQQNHCLCLFGARNVTIPTFRAQEVRGDGITVNSIDNASPLTVNSSNVNIGSMTVVNTADDGRNAISIISCEGLTLGSLVSIKVGGDGNHLLGERMPGGFDIEPDVGDKHLVTGVVTGPMYIETAGTSGVACIGHSLTETDATRDWNVYDINLGPAVVIQTSANAGGPVFRRNRNIRTSGIVRRTAARNYGASCSFQDQFFHDWSFAGVSNGFIVGVDGSCDDGHINVNVADHSAAGLQTYAVNRTRFTGNVSPRGQGAGSYGVQVAGSAVQTDVTYAVDVPNDAGKTFGFLTSAGASLTRCVVADCSFLGWSEATGFGFNVFINTRNVQGRNYRLVVPTTGYWTAGDFVENTAPTANGVAGWRCTVSGNPGTFVEVRAVQKQTGWTASTGTATKGAYATYAGQNVGAAYVEAEAQATDDAVKAVSQRFKALEDDLRTAGIIN